MVESGGCEVEISAKFKELIDRHSERHGYTPEGFVEEAVKWWLTEIKKL